MSLAGNNDLIQTNWESPPADPMDLMKDWVGQAKEAGIAEPLGMTLTTIDRAGLPWNRVVLIKKLNKSSIVFGSNSLSLKGINIEHNSRVSGSLWWRESIGQIQFCGFASVTTQKESEGLFTERSRDAQAVAICSQQSQPLVSELKLETKIAVLSNSGQPLLRPSSWNAYQIIPIKYEFWQGDVSRLHKRLSYSLQVPGLDLSQELEITESIVATGKWIQQRLQP